MDFQEGNPALSQGLDNATAILSLICLVAMVLGAIGVAMAMHAHLEQRMDMLAILKALGARSSDLLRIFLLQTLGLGLAGGIDWRRRRCRGNGGAACCLRKAVAGAYRACNFPWRSAAGLGTGLLTTLLFCLPPLLDVRNVRPVLVLRRLGRAGAWQGFEGWFALWWARRLQLGHCSDCHCGVWEQLHGRCPIPRKWGLVRGTLHRGAGRSSDSGCACAMACCGLRLDRVRLRPSVLAASWTGESLPARKSIRGSAGFPGNWCDADFCGLS